MTRIVCLANSWKHGERCIAGIDTFTKQWIRPISDLEKGKISKEMRQINGIEPALLEVLDIPLEGMPSEEDWERENRVLLPGTWKRLGHVSVNFLQPFCENEGHILHNDQRYVTMEYLQSLSFGERQTLQLVEAVDFQVRSTGKRFEAMEKWSGTVITVTGREMTGIITDPVFNRRLSLGDTPPSHCLVTFSLSWPWVPPGWKEEGSPCWKLIASVIPCSS
ncbi:hypothetical protein K4A83_03985 [Spirulina subsalsa FACHB-351]|uniref:Dual OB-containing domain-containing protein n=1 Tax=Spirulina subsalsa FACHB-351 TaxID=234711 RepID=A0ABT3L1R4_9CYAN|nr:hypothetical protein [Spirulina subsalsa]MCW6035437.1 hypothetical protein [Spirulina subsalsa FACHB-351]